MLFTADGHRDSKPNNNYTSPILTTQATDILRDTMTENGSLLDEEEDEDVR